MSRACLRSQVPLGLPCSLRTPRPAALAGLSGRVRTPGPCGHRAASRMRGEAPAISPRPQPGRRASTGVTAARLRLRRLACGRRAYGPSEALAHQREGGHRAPGRWPHSRHRAEGRPPRVLEVKLPRSPQTPRPWRGRRWVFPRRCHGRRPGAVSSPVTPRACGAAPCPAATPQHQHGRP